MDWLTLADGELGASYDWWERAFDRFGWPGILLIAIGICAYRSAKWLGPKIDKWFDKHFGLIDTLQEGISQQTNTLLTQTKGHEITHKALGYLGKAVHAGADDAKKPVVAPHIEAMREELN